jgi:hypothetical protein
MDIGSILMLLALVILVGLYISQPLLSRKAAIGNAQSSKLDHDLSTLLAEKERILEALEELDNDHELGKIPEEEYPLQRAEMMKKGADILRQIDGLQLKPVREDIGAGIEAAITARRGASSLKFESQATVRNTGGDGSGQVMERLINGSTEIEDDLEVRIASRRRERQSKSGGFCPQCGNPLHTSDHFCPKCGKPLD